MDKFLVRVTLRKSKGYCVFLSMLKFSHRPALNELLCLPGRDGYYCITDVLHTPGTEQELEIYVEHSISPADK